MYDYGWNLWLFERINRFANQTPWLHPFVTAYAVYGIILFGVMLLVTLWHNRHDTDRYLAKAVWACLAPLGAFIINQIPVQIIGQPRPYDVLPDVVVLVGRTTDPGFPSDHATLAGACTVGLLLAWPVLGRWAGVAALAMAFARVYVGAHFPLDVLAGLLFGGLIALVGWFVMAIPLTKLCHWLRTQPAFARVIAEGEEVEPEDY